MELQRETGEQTFNWDLGFTWRKWNCLVVLALKQATVEFERAFCLARKERNGSLVAATLILSGAPIWCSGEVQVSTQSPLAYCTTSLVQAVQSLSGWEICNHPSRVTQLWHAPTLS